MLKHWINTRKALLRLSADKDGVVSLEYVIVAACVVTVVIAAFNTGGSLPGALTSGFTAITTAMAAL
jgi:Flp pilus assembly pilin Flp